MDTTFEVLGLTAHAYGLCATVAALAMLAVMGVLGYKRRLPAGLARLLGMLGIALGILFARVLYCLVHLPDFFETYENPWLMLRFFDGGLSMTGLVGGLALAALIAARAMKARYALVMDVMCVPMGLAIAILRFGERFTDLGVGKVIPEGALTAAAPWLFLQSRMGVAVEYRLNVWAYEAVAGVVIFAATLAVYLVLSRRRHARQGDTALFFFTLYGASQTVLESMRDDGHMLIVFLRVGQVAAAFMPVMACGVLSARYARIRGNGGWRLCAGWAAMLLCVAGLAFLEFSLDGRVTWGTPSLGRDYAIMAALCAVMFGVPASLLRTLNARLYQEDHIAVHVPRG